MPVRARGRSGPEALLATLLLTASTLVCRGAETNTNAPSLTAEVRSESGPGIQPAKRAYLTAGTNRFAFLVPDGFRLLASAQDKVQLVNSDQTCLVTLLLLNPLAALGETSLDNLEDGETVRSLLLSRYPGAEIAETFALAAANRTGPAFDLRWHANSLTRAARVVYVPSAAGLLEFSLVASPENFGRFQPTLHTVMLTFRASGPDGKLEVAPLSTKL